MYRHRTTQCIIFSIPQWLIIKLFTTKGYDQKKSNNVKKIETFIRYVILTFFKESKSNIEKVAR